MKILHVSPLYSPSIGGNELHTQLISEKLAQLGEEVHVFTSLAATIDHFYTANDLIKKLPQQEKINGVHIQRFKINYWFTNLFFQRKIKIRGVNRLFRAVTGKTFEMWAHGPVIFGIFKAIGRLKPDVILVTNHYFLTTYFCCLAKKFLKIPLIIMPIIHSTDPWVLNPFLKVMYDSSDKLIACTDFEKNFLINHGQKADKVETIPLGIDPNVFKGSDGNMVKKKYGFKDGPIIAYFGRKIPRKGIETLIECMEIVWRQCPDAQLLLAGQEEVYFSSRMNECFKQYSDTDQQRIFNISNFSPEEKGSLYAAIDIMAMPSNTDCFGITYLEAWASGKPVIACKNTPQETIIRHGIDGLLVEYENKKELAEALITLLKDENARAQMGQNGKEILITKYNVNHYGVNLQEVYQKLLKE